MISSILRISLKMVLIFYEILNLVKFEYDYEAIFENAWDKIIQNYNIGSASWLDGIYKLKTKWAKCHMKNVFTLGV
jgi:hypothetical protein